ncbi:hypothetical protein GCM10020000_71620 [Streptomyces olivoverticillatus]
MPRKARAMPAEQITTYFQAASTQARVRRWPTRNAVRMVVASMAVHSTPRLAARTAALMAARKAWTRTW